MGKPLSSAIGLDVGRFALKAVRLSRSGRQIALTHYAVRQIDPDLSSAALVVEMRALLLDLGAKAAGCAVAIAPPNAILRTILQPETPPHLLREGLRINGLELLNQECRDYVIDCAQLDAPPTDDGASQVEIPGQPAPPPATAQKIYIVAGVPRENVAQIDHALHSAPAALQSIQLAPLALFHAFRLAKPEVADDRPFLMVDIGHLSSTIIVGAHGQFMLVRSIDFGGNELIDALMAQECGSEDDPTAGLETGDPASIAVARAVASVFAREIRSSIGFLEQQHEHVVERVFVSGGPARSRGMVDLLGKELAVACEAWDPFSRCEIALPAEKKASLEDDFVNLGIAAGAAGALLDPRDTAAMNLFHEIIAQRRARRRHPARIAAAAFAALLALLIIIYAVRLASVLGVEARAGRLAAEWAKLEPLRAGTELRISELNTSIRATGKLVENVEGRFYWAPLLERLLTAVPENVQLVRFAGKLAEAPKREVTLRIEGMVAGSEPRQAAEAARLAITESISTAHAGVTSRFVALDDAARSVAVKGEDTPMVSFTMEILLDPAAAPVAALPPPIAEPPAP